MHLARPPPTIYSRTSNELIMIDIYNCVNCRTKVCTSNFWWFSVSVLIQSFGWMAAKQCFSIIYYSYCWYWLSNSVITRIVDVENGKFCALHNLRLYADAPSSHLSIHTATVESTIAKNWIHFLRGAFFVSFTFLETFHVMANTTRTHEWFIFAARRSFAPFRYSDYRKCAYYHSKST